MQRREFIQSCAALAALPAFLKRRTDLAIGFQTWVVREPLAEDFAGTLAEMAAMGYETLEMCSPVGYGQYGFGPLANLSAREMKSIIADQGLTCMSSHYTPVELRDDIQARIAFAQELGLSQMVLSSPGLNANNSMDEWKRAIDEMNAWGQVITEAGLTFGYHNHNFEFDRVDGTLIYDILLEGLDAEVVKMQFQVWVVSLGYQAADYFRAYPGRFVSAHLADWSGTAQERTPIGGGVVDWPDFFAAGDSGGLRNIYVEMAPEYLSDSAAYLRSLR